MKFYYFYRHITYITTILTAYYVDFAKGTKSLPAYMLSRGRVTDRTAKYDQMTLMKSHRITMIFFIPNLQRK